MAEREEASSLGTKSRTIGTAKGIVIQYYTTTKTIIHNNSTDIQDSST